MKGILIDTGVWDLFFTEPLSGEIVILKEKMQSFELKCYITNDE